MYQYQPRSSINMNSFYQSLVKFFLWELRRSLLVRTESSGNVARSKIEASSDVDDWAIPALLFLSSKRSHAHSTLMDLNSNGQASEKDNPISGTNDPTNDASSQPHGDLLHSKTASSTYDVAPLSSSQHADHASIQNLTVSPSTPASAYTESPASEYFDCIPHPPLHPHNIVCVPNFESFTDASHFHRECPLARSSTIPPMPSSSIHHPRKS